MKILLLSGADQKYGTWNILEGLLETMTESNHDVQYVVITPNRGQINTWCENNWNTMSVSAHNPVGSKSGKLHWQVFWLVPVIMVVSSQKHSFQWHNEPTVCPAPRAGRWTYSSGYCSGLTPDSLLYFPACLTGLYGLFRTKAGNHRCDDKITNIFLRKENFFDN